MIHIKSIVADTQFSMIGSSNLDVRLVEINEELDVVGTIATLGDTWRKPLTAISAKAANTPLSNSGVARSGSEQWNGWLTPSVQL